jgi:hypothetical protein
VMRLAAPPPKCAATSHAWWLAAAPHSSASVPLSPCRVSHYETEFVLVVWPSDAEQTASY